MGRLKTAEERQQEQARYFEAMAKGYDPFNAFDKVEDHLGKSSVEEKNPFSKASAEFKRLLGPMVPAVYRDSSGALDVAKIHAQNLPEFRQFLQDQAALNDGKSFRNPYEKLLKDPKFQGLFALLYQERDPKFNVLSLDAEEAEGLLQEFTQRLVAIDADKFVQSHLSSQVGREKIRGLLVSGEIGKGLRADLSKAVARVEEECLPLIENHVSMWNYFNLGLTEQAANHAAHYALNALASVEDREANLAKMEREAKENPSRISTAGLKGAVGREILTAEIEVMVKYREAKSKGHDPLSQAQTKLADLWLMAVDTRRFVASEGSKIGYWNAYILKEAHSLIEASEGLVTESQLGKFNESLQAFLKDPVQGEEQGALHFVKSQLEMKEGLQEVFAKQPNATKKFYQDLLSLSDEWKYAQAMGEKILPREGLEKVEDPELSKVLQELYRMKGQLWYGYKQHKLISRGLSQAASLADRGDIQDIKQANKYLDETISALERSDEEGRKEIAKKLYQNFQKDGCLYKALEAAEMDGTEQVLGLVQTVGLMVALAMATRGVGAAARAGQVSAEFAEGATVAAEGAQGMARAEEASLALAETAQGSAKLIELGDKVLRGMGMGAYIATAENATAKLSGEVRVGRETILSWLKDAVATGAAMALVSPLATSAGESIHENLLKDLAQRYVSGGAKGALHFLADTGLEAVEEVLDQYARQVLDGNAEALSLGEIEEITKICLAGGGSKVGILAEHLKDGGASRVLSHAKHENNAESSKVNSEKRTKTAQDHGTGRWPALAKLSAAVAGLSVLLDSEPVQAAVDAAGQAAGSGVGALGTVLAGLGVLGAVGWWQGDSSAKRPSVAELETRLGELLDAEASPEELRQFWALAADQLQEMGLPQGEWIALALEGITRLKDLKLRKDRGEYIASSEIENAEIRELRKGLEEEIRNRFGIPVRVIFNLDLGFQISPKYLPSRGALPDGDDWLERLAEIMEGGHLPFLSRIFMNDFSKFDGMGLDSAKLQAWTRLKGVRELYINYINRGLGEAPGLPKLLGSPHLTGLRVLSIKGSQVGEEVIQALAHSQALSGLKDLSLENILGGPETFFPLAYSQNVGNLARLRILRSEYGDAIVHAVAESEECRNLKVLEVTDSQVGRPAAITLSRASHLRALERLIIIGGTIDDRAVEYLARSQYLVGLKGLVLMGHQITDRGAEALAQSRFLRELISLDLGLNPIGDAGLEALLQSDNFSNLETLGLERASISDRGLRALANARNMPRLQQLYLWRNNFGPDGRVALAGSLNGAKLTRVDWDDSVTFEVLRDCLTFMIKPGGQRAIIQEVRRLEYPEHRDFPSYRVIQVSHDALGVTLQNLQNPAETFTAYRDEPHQFQVGDEVKILALDPDGNVRELPKPEERSEKAAKVSSNNSGPGNGSALGLLLAGIGSGLATLLGADVAYAGVDPISQGAGGPSLAFLGFGVLMVMGFFHRIWSFISGTQASVARRRKLELDESPGYRGAARSPNELLARATAVLRECEADPSLILIDISLCSKACRQAIKDIRQVLLRKFPAEAINYELVPLLLAAARNYGSKTHSGLTFEDRRDFRLQVLSTIGKIVPAPSIEESLTGRRGKVLADVAAFLTEVCDEDLFERQDPEFWQAVREIFASKEGEDYLTYLRNAEAIRRSGGNLKASQQSYIVYALSLLWSGLVAQAPGTFELSHVAGLLLGLGAGVGAAFRHYQIAAQREQDQKLLDQEAQALLADQGPPSPRLRFAETPEKVFLPEEFNDIEETRAVEAEAETEAMEADPESKGGKNYGGPGGAVGLFLAGLGGGLASFLQLPQAQAANGSLDPGSGFGDVTLLGMGALAAGLAFLFHRILSLRKKDRLEEPEEEMVLQGQTRDIELFKKNRIDVEGITSLLANISAPADVQGLLIAHPHTVFYENGILRLSLLAEEQVLPGTSYVLVGRKESMVVFYPNGQLCAAFLARPAWIEGRYYGYGDGVTFHWNGKLADPRLTIEELLDESIDDLNRWRAE